MAKEQTTTKQCTVLSKTASGDQVIVSLQSGQGVHTVYLSKEEASQFELGDEVTVALTKGRTSA